MKKLPTGIMVALLAVSTGCMTLEPLSPTGDPGAYVRFSFTDSTQTTQAVKPLRVNGQRGWGQILKDQFLDDRDRVELAKSIGSWVLAIGTTTYAAGWWDEDDIFGGKEHDADQTRRAQANAVQAAAEEDKTVVRGDNNTFKDVPQNTALTVEGNGNIFDFQQDTSGEF